VKPVQKMSIGSTTKLPKADEKNLKAKAKTNPNMLRTIADFAKRMHWLGQNKRLN